MEAVDWELYPHFSPQEFKCSHTGNVKMDHGFMTKLQNLRNFYGKAMVITSGYRDPSHPKEIIKEKLGSHCFGRACDVSVHGEDALRLISLAMLVGFTGIGVHQKGTNRFIHLDDMDEEDGFSRPNLWSY